MRTFATRTAVVTQRDHFPDRAHQPEGKREERNLVMNVTIPPDLSKLVEQELATGRYQNSDQLIEQAVRYFLDERQRGQRRLDALRRIGQAVDQAGLYERILVPGHE